MDATPTEPVETAIHQAIKAIAGPLREASDDPLTRTVTLLLLQLGPIIDRDVHAKLSLGLLPMRVRQVLEALEVDAL